MKKIMLNNPETYLEAGNMLMDKLDLNNIQLSSLNHFLDNIIPKHLSIPIEGNGFKIRFLNWFIDYSKTYPDLLCKSEGKTREVELYATAEITVDEIKSSNAVIAKPSTTITTILIEKIPILSSTGSFIINGREVNMISHLGSPDGLSYNIKEGAYSALSLTTEQGMKLSLFKNKSGEMIRISSKIKPINGIKALDAYTSINALVNEFNLQDKEKKEVCGIPSLAPNYNKTDIVMKNFTDKLYETGLFNTERDRLNLKLMLGNKLIGRVLSRDLKYHSVMTDEDVVIKAGTTVTPDMTEDINNSGILKAYIRVPMGEFVVFGNQYVNVKYYLNKDAIPDALKHTTTNSVTGEKTYDYEYVNYNVLKSLLKEHSGSTDIELKLLLSSNIDKLYGTVLAESDLISMVNKFYSYIYRVAHIEDKDSLSNKMITCISNVFEKILAERLHGTEFGSIKKHLEQLIKDLKANVNTDGGVLDLSKLGTMAFLPISGAIVRPPYNSLFQMSANLNPIDESSHKRKVSLAAVEGYGGVNPEYAGADPRNVNPSQIGRLCPIETPEGKKVGLMVQFATLAIVNTEGFIEAPFFKIDKSTNTIDLNTVYYMTYDEEKYMKRAFAPNIAERDFARLQLMKNNTEIKSIELKPIVQLVNNKRKIINRNQLESLAESIFKNTPEADDYLLTMGLKNWFIDNKIDSIDAEGKLVKVNVDEIDYVTCRGDHIISAATANIPFSEYDDGTRLMMGANMSKQAVPVRGSEKPLVFTSLTPKIGEDVDEVIKSPVDGIIKQASATEIVISPFDGDDVVVPTQIYRISSEDTSISNRVVVKNGDIVKKGDILADIESTRDGELAVGTNLYVGYCVWEGYNYEDGIVISDRLLNEDILTSMHITEYEATFDESTDITITDYINGYAKDTTTQAKYRDKIDNDSQFKTLKIGTRIKTNDKLFIKYTQRDDSYVEKITFYKGEPGTLINVLTTKDEKDKTVVKFHVLSEEEIKVGDKLAGRHGNKGTIARIVPRALMPYTEDGITLDIILTPLGVPSRMNVGQLLEAQTGLVLKDLGIRAETQSGRKLDIPKIKMLTNMYTGDEQGKIQLFDGRTGMPFEQKSNVGVTTINKLKHLSAHKLAGRGRGKPSEYLANGQPTQGMSRNGGQKIGEMELWAFLADNATESLREIQVYKSDDPYSRTKFDKYIKGDGTIKDLGETSNFSQSYKKMASILAGMGLRMEHLDEEGNVIDIYKDKSVYAPGGASAITEEEFEARKSKMANENQLTDMTDTNELAFGDAFTESGSEELRSLLGIEDEEDRDIYVDLDKDEEFQETMSDNISSFLENGIDDDDIDYDLAEDHLDDYDQIEMNEFNDDEEDDIQMENEKERKLTSLTPDTNEYPDLSNFTIKTELEDEDDDILADLSGSYISTEDMNKEIIEELEEMAEDDDDWNIYSDEYEEKYSEYEDERDKYL